MGQIVMIHGKGGNNMGFFKSFSKSFKEEMTKECIIIIIECIQNRLEGLNESDVPFNYHNVNVELERIKKEVAEY